MVKSEEDSGFETLWLLKKMAFLSEKETREGGGERRKEGEEV